MLSADPLHQGKYQDRGEPGRHGYQLPGFLVQTGHKYSDHEKNVAAGGDGRADRGEERFEEHRPAHEKSQPRTDGAPPICQRTAGERHRHRQLRQTQNPGHVQSTDEDRGQEHPHRPAFFQSRIPTKVFTGNDDADSQRPDVQDAHRFLKCVFFQVGFFIGTERLDRDMCFPNHLFDDLFDFGGFPGGIWGH